MIFTDGREIEVRKLKTDCCVWSQQVFWGIYFQVWQKYIFKGEFIFADGIKNYFCGKFTFANLPFFKWKSEIFSCENY